MADFITLVRRQADSVPIPHTMVALLVVLLVLLIMTILLVAALYFFRQRRRSAHRPDLLSMYDDEKRLSTSSTSSHHRRVMVRPSESVYVYSEKGKQLDDSAPSTPTSPIPEIRITFPEEYDDSGKRQSGRVVVVRVGETSIGLEPVNGDEKPPVYQNDGRFQSLDLERVGGLVEKARNAPSKEWQ